MHPAKAHLHSPMLMKKYGSSHSRQGVENVTDLMFRASGPKVFQVPERFRVWGVGFDCQYEESAALNTMTTLLLRTSRIRTNSFAAKPKQTQATFQ